MEGRGCATWPVSMRPRGLERKLGSLARRSVCGYRRAVAAAPDLAHVLAHVPVVPLPNTVLFPGVVLPLHLFERRFVELIDDVAHGYGHLVVCHLPGRPDRQALARVGCLARVVRVHRRQDTTVDVLLEGVRRVQLQQEVAHPRRYRCFRAVAVPPPTRAQHEAAGRQLAQLQSCVVRLGASAARCDRPLVEVLRATPDPIALADLLAASLVGDVAQQQAVLASDTLARRLQLLVDGLAEAVARLGQRAGTAGLH